MTRRLFCAVLFCWWALGSSQASAAPQATSQTARAYYLDEGMTRQAVREGRSNESYTEWQIWLYPRNARLADRSAYVRWAVLAGASPETVTKQLAVWQHFERAYANFFGLGAWGRFTFSHPVGPIAVTASGETREASAMVAEADHLNRRVSAVVAAILPSLENNQNSDSASPAAAYFEQVRDCLFGIVRFHDQATRLSGESGFLKLQLARLRDEVRGAEAGVSKITAMLPSVKLAVAKGWMTQTEYQGSDGTMETTIADIGNAAWIRRVWSGGDGSMTGTAMVTVVPYQDIGTVEVVATARGDRSSWTLSIRPAGHAGFPQSITGPARTTSKRSIAAVDFVSRAPLLFLDFSAAEDAQNAYAFFLYHKQMGR